MPKTYIKTKLLGVDTMYCKLNYLKLYFLLLLVGNYYILHTVNTSLLSYFSKDLFGVELYLVR